MVTLARYGPIPHHTRSFVAHRYLLRSSDRSFEPSYAAYLPESSLIERRVNLKQTVIHAAEGNVDAARVTITLRCPACKKIGTMQVVAASSDLCIRTTGDVTWAGFRRCPNTDCFAVIFFASDTHGKLLVS